MVHPGREQLQRWALHQEFSAESNCHKYLDKLHSNCNWHQHLQLSSPQNEGNFHILVLMSAPVNSCYFSLVEGPGDMFILSKKILQFVMVMQWCVRCTGIEDGVHGTGGLMRVENPRYNNPLHDVFFQASQQAGIPENDNFNNWGRSQVRAPLFPAHCTIEKNSCPSVRLKRCMVLAQTCTCVPFPARQNLKLGHQCITPSASPPTQWSSCSLQHY